MKGQHQEGAIAVEFALILPVMVLMLFGIVEFSLLLFNKQILTNASREGARFGIAARNPRYNDGEIRTVVENYCAENLITFGTPNLRLEPPPDRAGTDFGHNLTISVRIDYDFLFLSGIGFDPVVLTARTVMKME